MTNAVHDVFLVPSQYPTISEALDAVVRPGTIMISPGVYAEDVRVVGKEYVVIESARLSRRGVTLAGGGVATVLAIEGSVVHLSGIEIRSNQRARGISAVDSSLSLQECVVAGNRAGADSGEPFGAGMLCRNSNVRIQKSTIAGNTIEHANNAAGGGVHFSGCKVEIAGSSIQTNAIYASETARGGGIWCEQSRLRMWRSRVTDNLLYAQACEGGGIYFRDSLDAQLGGSVITGNGSVSGNGGGVFIFGDPERVSVHRNTIVRLNHPADLYVEETGGTTATSGVP
jgi:Right handed beta helix region